MRRTGETSAPASAYSDAEAKAGSYAGTPVPRVLRRADYRERQARLASVIAQQIVPRLLLIHKNARVDGDTGETFTSEEITEFGDLTMAPDSSAARAYFEKMQASGHSLDTLFVHLLAPTARRLGEYWDQDLCDFVDVTIGVSRLQELLTIFGAADDIPLIDLQHRVLLATAPGEQHVVGIDMVGKLMRASGWDTTVRKGPSIKEIAADVAAEWYAVVGVALSAEEGLEEIGRSIDEMRRVSRNKHIGVMVGGPVFTGHPERAIQVGADGVADDAPAAVILAKKLLLMQARMV
jgi:methanogenic corrinoid protein MtbC1